MNKSKKISALITCLTIAALAANAWADVQNVICVPWQGNPQKYHTAISGQSVRLKAVIKTTDTSTIWYRWVYGDGTQSSVYSTSGNTKYNVQSDHAYTGAPGTPFTAKLLVDDVDNSMANAVSDNYLLKIEDNTLDARINVAIDNGLWTLYQLQWTNGNCHSLNGEPVTVWSSYASYYVSPTASAVHAFEINGHKETGDPNEDPYAESVKKGLNWLFNGWYRYSDRYSLRAYSIGPQHGGTDDPDTNANGIGIEVRDYSTGRPIYQGGMVMDAIIAAGTPDKDCGRDFDNDGQNDTYRQVVQDMADMYAWGQYDGTASGYGLVGGWRYSWNSWPDNSAAQWAAIGMLPAQESPWNCDVPDWVKTYNDNWLDYSYNSWTSGGVTYGSFGYTSKSTHSATTPSGMVQLVFVGATTADPRWTSVERWFADNWKDQGSDWLDWNNVYAYYSFAKAMRLALPHPVVTFSSNNFDWYRGSYNKMGLAEKISNQLINYHKWNYYGDVFGTAWCVIILRPVLFEEAPIACFEADPNPSYPDVPIYFDPSCSGHSQPGKDIDNLVLFEWDWDQDGTFDQSTTEPDVITHTFSCPSIPCVYPVQLKVTDDVGNTATYVMNIDVTNPPHPPVARAGGPYIVSRCPSDSLVLDGSDSYEPDEGTHEAGCPQCPNDTITAWDWDLDGAPFTYQSETGEIIILDGADFDYHFPQAGLYDIGLRVTDNTENAYPASGEPNLTDESFAVVDVYDGCICEVNAVAVCHRIFLSWDDIGADSYDVFRSFAGENTGYEYLKTVTVPQSSHGSFVMGKEHWYRIMAAFGNDKCLSKAAYAYGDPNLCNPTADHGGPYSGCVGEEITLDGSDSTALSGEIIQWTWDLDNDGQYDDENGKIVQHSWNTPGQYTIGLRVMSSDSLTLFDTNSTTVSIELCDCIDDLAARAKRGKVQLTWTHDNAADCYNVYRSVNPNVQCIPANRIVNCHTTTYATYLDDTPINGITYYYKVTKIVNGVELCKSNEVTAKPDYLSRYSAIGSMASEWLNKSDNLETDISADGKVDMKDYALMTDLWNKQQ